MKKFILAATLLLQTAYADTTTLLATPLQPELVAGVNIFGAFNGNWNDQTDAAHWTQYNEVNIATACWRQGFRVVRVTFEPEWSLGWTGTEWEDQTAWAEHIPHLATMVKELQARGILVILNPHPFNGSGIRDDLNNDENSMRTLYPDWFINLLARLEGEGVNFSSGLIIEMMNEPGLGETFDSGEWATLQADHIAHVRAEYPDIPIIIKGDGTETVSQLGQLSPGYKEIASVHYYLPGGFTHQGLDGLPSSVPWPNGAGQDFKAMESDFATIRKWATVNNTSVIIGEMGANTNAATADRLNWLASMGRLAKQYRIPVIMWTDGDVWAGLDTEADGDVVIDKDTINALTND